jgi:hypothetical protein
MTIHTPIEVKFSRFVLFLNFLYGAFGQKYTFGRKNTLLNIFLNTRP